MIISDKLINIIKEIDNINPNFFSKLFIHHYERHQRDFNYDYIDISNDDKYMFSYLTKDKIKIIKDKFVSDIIDTDYFWKNLRYKCKIPKLLMKIVLEYNKDFHDRNKNILLLNAEMFYNTYRSLIKQNDIFKFKIVEGEDIRKYYHYSMYDSSVMYTLNSSCMRYDENQPTFDIYIKNNDIIKMLIYVNDNDKISGRALLWYIDDKIIMDRIYVNSQEVLDTFKKWAYDNDVYYKTEQNYYNTTHFNFKDNKNIYLELKVKLKQYDNMRYPYVDTFKWLKNDGYIYNYYPYKNENNKIKTLTLCNGEYKKKQFYIKCHINGIFYQREEFEYITYLNKFIHKQNLVYSEILNCYILNIHSVLISNNINEHSYIFNDEYKDYNDTSKIEEFMNRKIDKLPYEYLKNDCKSYINTENLNELLRTYNI